jgi:hypothetical protein
MPSFFVLTPVSFQFTNQDVSHFISQIFPTFELIRFVWTLSSKTPMNQSKAFIFPSKGFSEIWAPDTNHVFVTNCHKVICTSISIKTYIYIYIYIYISAINKPVVYFILLVVNSNFYSFSCIRELKVKYYVIIIKKKRRSFTLRKQF